jgi:hypothetical protein
MGLKRPIFKALGKPTKQDIEQLKKEVQDPANKDISMQTLPEAPTPNQSQQKQPLPPYPESVNVPHEEVRTEIEPKYPPADGVAVQSSPIQQPNPQPPTEKKEDDSETNDIAKQIIGKMEELNLQQQQLLAESQRMAIALRRMIYGE